ncbi:phosphoribosylaminoimidazolesuccinocarboxamide synthase [Candidatus Micrarchaeota archaeon]|nr:phosphoribosylaminoimidazolesuccinocarboxamide synthase [Candidatus Micrarchaeota archaeon]
MSKAEIDLPFVHRGKVRDTYELDGNLLIISTDRISAFDSIFPNPIPRKGEVLNRLSLFWFKKTRDIVKNHLISDQMPENLKSVQGRAMIVKKAQVVPMESVVRGYLTGSGWKEYKEQGTLAGIKLPEGLKNGSRLPEPTFTPATKAESGHDINISVEEAENMFGKETVDFIKSKAIALYNFAHDYLLTHNLILADTKFEFGKTEDGIILVDEALTPDSSRYWLMNQYEKGILDSMDKQFLRNYLEQSGWNKEPPAPQLPEEIINKTSERYLKAYEMITGEKL